MNAVALSADGRHALSGSADGTIRLWNLENGTCLAMFPTNVPIYSLACSQKDPLVVVAGDARGMTSTFWKYTSHPWSDRQ